LLHQADVDVYLHLGDHCYIGQMSGCPAVVVVGAPRRDRSVRCNGFLHVLTSVPVAGIPMVSLAGLAAVWSDLAAAAAFEPAPVLLH